MPTGRHARGGRALAASVLDRLDRIAAVGLLLHVWNRQVEKRGDRFRSLIEYSTDPILAFGADGCVVYHSPSHYPLLGYEEEELLNAQVDDLIRPGDLSAWCSGREDQTNDDQFFLRKLHVQHKYRYLESHMVNLLDHISLRAFIVNSWDVTQRREMAEALHIAKQAAKRTS